MRQKIAFITGAASGIGRATAELLAEEGWWIGAADRNAEGLALLQEALGEERCRPWHLDVTDKAAYDAVIAELSEETGRTLPRGAAEPGRRGRLALLRG